MPIDFSDMLDDDDEVTVHPRDIFFTLNRYLVPDDESAVS